ncbi:hypothetical protein GGR55DRAFT_669207 [Xylaria sp. FL0064]|nr:hypothetical protein GGR55DRAFT_669207 [Xylaria sp. FL0064]
MSRPGFLSSKRVSESHAIWDITNSPVRLCQAKYACAIAFIFCLVPICAGLATWRVSPHALEFPWLRIMRAWAGMLAFGIVVLSGLAIAACCSDAGYKHPSTIKDNKKTT